MSKYASHSISLSYLLAFLKVSRSKPDYLANVTARRTLPKNLSAIPWRWWMGTNLI